MFLFFLIIHLNTLFYLNVYIRPQLIFGIILLMKQEPQEDQDFDLCDYLHNLQNNPIQVPNHTNQNTTNQGNIPTQRNQEQQGLHQNPQFFSNQYRIYHRPCSRRNTADVQIPIREKISLLAWNVWKQPQYIQNSNMRNRYNQVIKVIKEKNPDIICLQQTQLLRGQYLQNFLNNFGQIYYYSDPSYNSTIILSKFPSKFYEIKFRNIKAKPMSICQFRLKCQDNKTRSFIVNSVHFKAFPQFQVARRFQLKVLQKINSQFDVIILAGDFNYGDESQDYASIKYKYLDLQRHKLNKLQNDSQPSDFEREGVEQENNEMMIESGPRFIQNARFLEQWSDQSSDNYSDDYQCQPIQDESSDYYDSSSDEQLNGSHQSAPSTPPESSSTDSDINSDQRAEQEGDSEPSFDQQPFSEQEEMLDQYSDGYQQSEGFNQYSGGYQQSERQYQGGSGSDFQNSQQGEYHYQQFNFRQNQYQQLRQRQRRQRQRRQRQRRQRQFYRMQRQKIKQKQRRQNQRQLIQKQMLKRQKERLSKERKLQKERQKIQKQEKKKQVATQKQKNQSQLKIKKIKSEIKIKINVKVQMKVKIKRQVKIKIQVKIEIKVEIKQERQKQNKIKQNDEKSKQDQTWTYLYFKDKNKYRLDRILIKSNQYKKQVFKRKINPIQFTRLGLKTIRPYEDQPMTRYLHDRKVRTASDHLGLYTQFSMDYYNM